MPTEEEFKAHLRVLREERLCWLEQYDYLKAAADDERRKTPEEVEKTIQFIIDLIRENHKSDPEHPSFEEIELPANWESMVILMGLANRE